MNVYSFEEKARASQARKAREAAPHIKDPMFALSLADFTAVQFAVIDRKPRREAVALMRRLYNVEVAANATQAQFAAAWEDSKERIAKQHAFGRLVLELSGAASLAEAEPWLLKLKADAEEHARLTQRLAELKQQKESNDLDKALAAAKGAHKLTPALEKTLRERHAAKAMTLDGVVTMLAALPPIKALVAAADGAAAGNGGDADSFAAAVYNGKAFNDLTGPERSAFKRAHPELYAAAMKKARRR